MNHRPAFLASACLLILTLLGATAARASDAMAANEADGTNWPLYGRTFSANHFSPLTQVNTGNVSSLGLAWHVDLPDHGALLTAPIAVDGVLYFSQGLSVIHALDGKTGKLLWKYDPEAGKVAGLKLRVGWGVRGIAYWDGRIYTATVDGRLIAIDAKTGKRVWETQTTEGPEDGRYVTGPPWVFQGKVIIGHGGADLTFMRGYVTAYDARTGKQAWRFYIVPGDPAKGFENAAMKMAATTWKGEWWKMGGGGTAWNAMAYDPKYRRVYIGTGNGGPWNQRIRSPGGGDNLFLCSIVALDADTGEYIWHYQVNPGETWDYNATMDIELATVNIDGKPRDVLMQAPKNGFFYVLDRATGKLISAKNFVPVNWASGIDPKTGRPIENPAARFPNRQGFMLVPSNTGGHKVQSMSYSPTSGLAYIPASENAFFYSDAGVDYDHWYDNHRIMGYITGLGKAVPSKPAAIPQNYILAWNPLTQKSQWKAPLPPGAQGGGIISTGGNLVINGQSDGQFNILSATSGKKLWSFDAQAGISSEPITYMVDGKQYITLLTGYRGVVWSSPWDYRTQKRRVLTFALNGKDSLPPAAPPAPKQFVDDPSFVVDDAKANQGEALMIERRCVECHGANLTPGGAAPDLRESPIPLSSDAMYAVVHDGLLETRAMPKFPELSRDEIEAIRHYIRRTERAAKDNKPTTGPAVIRQ